ncbi:MAG: FeoC-like transcriptional regulator [Legionella sp.]
MLLKIRKFIQQQQIVTIEQLMREFRIDEQALIPMLTIWVKKGVIHICEDNRDCKASCGGCRSKASVYYQVNRIVPSSG